MQKKPRIFMGFSNVAGYYGNLAIGFKALGITAHLFDAVPNVFQYDLKSDQPFFLKLLSRINSLKHSSNNKALSVIAKIIYVSLRPVFFIWAMLFHDVFIFSGHSSFLRFYDLQILKFFGKKIIYLYHGSDVRPGYMSGVHPENGGGDTPKGWKRLAEWQIAQMRKEEKYADVIINNTGTAQFCSRPIVKGLAIGIPSLLEEHKIDDLNKKNRDIKIVHAPSRPGPKGTYEFRAVIEKLKNEGYKIDYRELYKVPNSVVLKELAQCDFVLDQVYSDTPLAGLAAEAAFFGKVSVVGSYYTELENENMGIPFPPSALTHPDKLEETVRDLLDNPEKREQLGKDAKDFVQTYWRAEVVAKSFLRLIEDDIPEHWTFDPKETKNAYGACISKENLRKQLKAMYDIYGEEGFMVSDKPQLLANIMSIINDD